MCEALPVLLEMELIALAKKHDLARLFLFGSRARGEHSQASDVDIAAQGGDFAGFYLDVEEKINSLLNFDVVNLDQASAKLKQEIRRDGKLIMSKYDNFVSAVDSLERMLLKHPETDTDEAVMTGIIAACNFAFDQCWKAMKLLCLQAGAPDENMNSPRAVLKVAASYNIVDLQAQNQWLDFLLARNVLTHRDNENLAQEALTKVRHVYFPLLVAMRDKVLAAQSEIE